ncbi:MAG: sulfatase-like hydrolase/transferase [Planctomycetota bacterium]
MTVSLLTALVAAGALSSTTQAEPPEPPRPNVVLILADDFGFECVGANGGTSYETPHLDRMAAEGIRFLHCHATPLCTPSRVQLMTGQYSFRNYERFGYLDADEVTFGTLLKDAGYATGVFGKWQLNYGVDGAGRPGEFGFDTWCLWNARKDPGSRYADPRLVVDGEVRDLEGAWGPEVVSEHALDFVRARQDEAEPFFLYYPMILPHSPFVPSPWSERREGGKQELFGDMVAGLDLLVGRLLDELVELGIAERTLVLFVGDNGTHRPIRSVMDGEEIPGGKSFMTMAGTHVPMIAWWPGTAEPAVLDDLVDLTDFLPTICDAAGVESAARPRSDGTSFLPRLRGEAGSPREWIFCHYDPRWNVPGKPGRYVFDGRFKLYHDGRLFDVTADRAERSPLAAPAEGDPAAARARLQAVLDSMPHWDPPAKSRRKKR